ncbi:MAG: LysR family transcriptional regulator [Oscillospiraceae bacterium]|nr:LysR family transcriptional regulator [Oscillospiraceae bacterium]
MTAKLELYRVFKEVAEAGNISLAAQNLYISQSAVSQNIKQLEQALQTRLFMRSPRGVALTEEGRMLYEHVRSAIGLLETGEDKLAQTRALQMGKLVIGASDTVTSQLLLGHLDRFNKRHPHIRIQIVSGRSHKVLGLLRSGRVEIAFASSTEDNDALVCTPCLRTHTSFVAAADYNVDFEHEYSEQEIAALPLILLERKASSRVYLEKYFLSRGVPLSPEIELGARSLLVDLARIGFGVAGVTREFVRTELKSGVIRELKTTFSIPTRTVDMCTLRDVPMSAATECFIREFTEAMKGEEK